MDILKKYWIVIILTITGGVGGYLYWFFVGCVSGSCPITSSWYYTFIFGIFAGYIVGDTINNWLKKKRKDEGSGSE